MNKLMKMKSIILYLLLLQSILNVANFTIAEPIYGEIFRCKTDSGTFKPNSPYKTNLMSALKKLPGLKSISVGDKPNEKVTAVALCAGYLKPQDCVSCVNKTIPLLQQKCPNQKGAAAWRVTCMVRYGAPVVNNFDIWFVAHEVSELKVKDAVMLEESLSNLKDKLMRDLYIPRPGFNQRAYAYGVLNIRHEKLHMVMQCTENILDGDCNKCLVHIFGEIKSCCSGAIAAAILTPNCYMRYAHSDFRVL